MRAIHLARLDKVRPVVVLTREVARPHMNRVTVVPVTSRARGLSTEIALGAANGLDHDSVANCDAIATIPTADLGAQVGFLLDDQEAALAAAVCAAFDLDV